MPIVAAINLPVTTKDPCEAVRDCIKLIRTNASSLAGLEIQLGLHCTSNREILTRLAERLPPTALGFCNLGSDRALTVDQFKAQPAKGFCTFQGKLTAHLEPSRALLLIEELLDSPPSAIRSTAFFFNVAQIQWNGAPLDCAGSLNLFDLKAFQRTGRFSLSVGLQLPGSNPKAPEVKTTLEQIARATGIAFDKGHVSRVLGEKGNSPEYAATVLIGQICFDEVVENVAARLPSHLISEFATNALSRNQALEQRLQQWGSEASGKVNLASVLKGTIKELMPELKFGSADAEQILFRKSFGATSEIVAVFSKAMLRIGKAFNLSLGVRSVADEMGFEVDVFQFERSVENKIWIYADLAGAKAVASEAINLMKGLLPRFESSLQAHFAVWPKDLPAEIERHGNLTARQAFKKAQPRARDLFPDAALVRAANHVRSLKTRDIEGPELSTDGRLTKNAAWWFHFYSEKHDVSFQITVPFVGSIRVLDHGAQYQDVNTRHYLVPVGEDWLDSDQAFVLAEERGGRARRESGRTFGISAKLQMSASQQPYWGIFYMLVDERGRNDLIVNLDAVTGEALNSIRGF